MAFTADGKVAVMEHHASAGWPTAIMAQGFMAKGLHGSTAPVRAARLHYANGLRLRSRRDHRENDVANSAFRPGWLALGRARLDQLAVESFYTHRPRAPRSMSSLLIAKRFPVGLGEPATTVVGARHRQCNLRLPSGPGSANLPIRPAIVLEALTRAKPAQ
jgi:hypothetical protein